MKSKKDKKEKVNNSINKVLNRKSDFKIYELVLFAILIMMASVFLTFLVVHEVDSNKNGNNGSSFTKNDDYLNEFEEVYQLINDSYYKNVDKKTLVEGAINGMLGALEDPHTSYFNKNETENFNESMNGSYEGIGAEISINNNGEVFIFSVFKNSPASEAGIKFNDVIISVNEKMVKGMSTTEVVTLIKDPDKPVANIKVSRDGQILEFNVTKRVVVIESVESKIYDVNGKKVGYVTINNFANNTYEQFRKQIESMEEKEIAGLVIDVRGNSGGYLHSVTSMLDMFLSKGTVMYQISDKKTTYKYTSSTAESRNYPVTVLVNKASASASEILAISLKESYGAEIVGTNTYGKGTVQITKDLKGGAMIKYTIQKWLSPKGNWINEVGVEPTLKVELSHDYELNQIEENDNQLWRALEITADK